MSSELTKRSRVAPLQRVEALPITDPTEIAAIEERIAEWKRWKQQQEAHPNGDQATLADVLRWCDALPEEDRVQAAVSLVGRLDVTRFLAALPESARKALDAALRPAT